MGTWGTDAFDNDHACDFAHDMAEAGDLELLDEALQQVLDFGDEELAAPVAEEALVAAEVVARLQGRFGVRNAYTECIDAWVAANPGPPSSGLIAKALKAIDRIVSEPSELLELWEDGDDADAWKKAVAELRARVGPP
jgi:hypothetical protein